MGLKLITAPASEPVSLQEAKDHLRIIDTDTDTVISSFITAARLNVEKWTARALIDQTWDLYLDAFPTEGEMEIQIPLPPLIEVVSIKYDDSGGVEQTLSPSSYYVDAVNEPGWVVPAGGASWPTPLDAINSVRVRFRAGYLKPNSPAEADVPFDIKAATLLLIGTMFEHREAQVVGTIASKLPWGVENLLRPHRVALGMS